MDVIHRLAENNVSLNILEINHTWLDSSWKATNVISPYSRLYYIMNGEGFLHSNGEKILLKPGNLYFIPLGTLFGFGCNSSIEKLYLHVNLFLENKLDFFEGINKVITIPSKDAEKLCEYIKKDGIFSNLAIKGIIYNDLLKIAEVATEDRSFSCNSKIVSDAISFINDNLSVKLSIGEIADAVFVSPSLLRKKFREEMNISIGKYIDTRVIFEAQQMLSKEDLSIDFISETLGFCDRFYFTRRFREQIGLSPGEYKKNQRLKG